MEITNKLLRQAQFSASKKAIEKVDFIESFINFDISIDYMEASDHTKLGKVLTDGLKKLYAIPLAGLDFSYIHSFTCKYQDMWIERRVGEKNKEKVMGILTEIEEEIVVKYNAIGKSRLTRNGKIPKAQQIKNRREAIKGELEPKFKEIINGICSQFKVIIHDRLVERINSDIKKLEANGPIWKLNRRSVNHYIATGVIKYNGSLLRFSTPGEIEELAIFNAESQTKEFYFKMADKLGGMKLTSDKLVGDGAMDKANPDRSTLVFKLDDSNGFTMVNKVIVNWSCLGKPFYQYPCTFHDAVINGERVKNPSEDSIKKMINQINR